MHKIEKNIPIYESNAKFGKWIKLASEMEIGDSVLLNSQSEACGLYQVFARTGGKMVQRKVAHDQFRCWRVK